MKALVLLFALLAILAACQPVPSPPAISTAGLDPATVTLIQQQLSAVHASRKSAEAWGKLGGILKSYGFREQADVCLAEAERLDRKNPRWPYFRAALGTNALENLRRTVALCGNDPEMPRLRLARLLAESGQQDAARAELQELLRSRPNSAPARLLLAQISSGRNELGEAIALAKICTTNSYTVRSAWTLLAALYRRQGDTNAADIASRRAAAVTPDVAWPDPFEEEVLALRTDARSLSDRAQSYLMAGRATDAMPIVNQLVRNYPDFAETWLLLGRAQNLSNRPADAEPSLRRFLQMDPNSVNGHFQLGMSLLAQKRFDEAAATFRHATTLKRDFGPAFFNLGFALAKSGKPRDAIPAFHEAVRQNPEMIDAYILLADLYVQLGQSAEASDLTGRAERLNPSDPRLPVLRKKIQP
ncbi:MAG TPA: tetratricopeptide repeat protein [Verrucomicrobiae bacterium]|nr:tetratricopeptide repeat protein [Verrucomicrobiae bacterium]